MLKTFPKGGVHPPENKLSADKKIITLGIPEQVVIPLQQHLGAPNKVLVDKKAKIKVGQRIVEAGGFVSANVHSSVSGTVLKVDEMLDTSGYKKLAVVIKVEGDEWEPTIDTTPDIKHEITLSAEEIVKKASEMGIVGLGGATFPTHVKLSIPKGQTCEFLIINGVECEPYLTSDHRLMLEHGEELLIGTKIFMKALNVTKAFIGIENNKPDAIEHLTNLASKIDADIEIVPLKVQYPQGGEKQLIKAITGREVPSGGLPIHVGVVVQNVGTTYAIYEAVQKNKPLIDRIVTLTGKSVKNPGNFKVRIGTPISMLIEEAGGLPEDTGKIINGGPMMGKAIKDTEIPVTKGTSGILIMTQAESKRGKIMPCIRCTKCVNVCPQGLEPYLLMSVAEKQMWEQAEKEHNMDCIECGSCSFICPSDRPLLDYIRFGKQNVGAMIRARNTK
ncbi:MAG: electron transport complex subunit RsxC [Paludibacteraceae bacterium]|nr:electron transport complex subunit RsxC [Paludibacteraceae bacterium]